MEKRPFNTISDGILALKVAGLNEQDFHDLFNEDPSACLTLKRDAFYPETLELTNHENLYSHSLYLERRSIDLFLIKFSRCKVSRENRLRNDIGCFGIADQTQ